MAGLELPLQSSWGGPDVAAKLMGLYECEVVDVLVQAAQGGRSTLIDMGAADGFFAVGCLQNDMFKMAVAYEATEAGRSALGDNAHRNGVADRLKIRGRVEATTIPDLVRSGTNLADAVVLCDIEGGEFDLFTIENLKALRQAVLIIEAHDWSADKDTLDELVDRARKYFDVRRFRTGARDLSGIECLHDWSDNDRWLVASEGRRELGTWIHCVPRSSTR
jgi:hypothetical protein